MTLQPKTAIEAFNSKSKSVVLLKKELGETVLNAFLALAVSDLVESFNIGKTMNAIQVAFVVETIKTDYYFLKVEDLKFCFNEAKKGRYGTIYDRIDCAVICEWVEKYLEQRVEIAIEQNSKTKKEQELSKNEAALFLAKNLNLKKKPVAPVIKREPTDEEVLMNELLEEFDLLHKEALIAGNAIKGGVRYINYKGKPLNQNDYCLEKIKEMKEI